MLALCSESNIEFLAHQDTAIGTLILRRRALLSKPGTVVTEITLDHEFLMSSYITVSERALSRIALEMHTGEPAPGPGRRARARIHGLGGPAVVPGRAGRGRRVRTGGDHLDEGRSRPALQPAGCGSARGDRGGRRLPETRARPRTLRGRAFDLILIDVDHSPAEHLGDAGNENRLYTPLLPNWNRMVAALPEVMNELEVLPYKDHKAVLG